MAAAGGPRLVVRNTFLEVFDDSPPGGDHDGSQRRPRAQTDMTDAKLPRKVSYPVNSNEPAWPLAGGPTSPSAGYSPVRINEISEEPPRGAMLGKGGGTAMMPGTGPLGPAGAMGMTPFPGFPGHFPPPWGYAPMGAGATFPGFPGLPWGYPVSPFAPMAGGMAVPLAAQPQQQHSRGVGRRNQQGEKGGGGKKGSGRGGLVHEPQPQQPGGGRGAGGGGRPAAAAPQQPPRAAVEGASEAVEVEERVTTGTETTVMLRNIPNRYAQDMLLSLLDEHGFKPSYDFVYLPMDFRNGVNLGYAFVNLLTHEDALHFMETFQGFSRWFVDSAKVCEVSWAHPHQGLYQHVERYRNSPVMHPTMPEEYKPMIFKAGERVPFPSPTKAIRAPKLRPVHDRQGPAQQEP